MATCTYNFYPRSPCGERPATPRAGRQAAAISIHALLAESDVVHVTEHASPGRISIHALLAESDITDNSNRHSELNFYPRSPCGERLVTKMTNFRAPIFLSTLSLRRATLSCAPPFGWRNISIHALLAESDITDNSNRHSELNFYPRSPCGERLAAGTVCGIMQGISIHALLAESDRLKGQQMETYTISIHALLAESDVWRLWLRGKQGYFYPRSPCGERR